MQVHEYETRLARPTRLKLSDFQHNQRLFHVILPNQFTNPSLVRLSGVADRIRLLAASKEGSDKLRALLSHKRAMLYFTQASTRTFLSFASACQVLGMPYTEIRDPSVSSEYKGESQFDSVRMFSTYFDLIVMRTLIPSFAECCAYLMNDLLASGRRGVPVVNAGSGADQHPTQALLDIYTLQRAFEFSSPKDSSKWTRFDDLRKRFPDLRKGLDGKTYVFCGDIGRGRTVRSLSYLLSQFKGVTMHFVAPAHEKLALSRDLKEHLLRAGVSVLEHDSLVEPIRSADALYMTRIQREHNKAADAEGFSKIDFSNFRLTRELVESMKEYAVILHPFPRNEEIPDEIDSDPRAMYFAQAENGMWIRAALLAHIFDADSEIDRIFAEFSQEVHDYNEGVL